LLALPPVVLGQAAAGDDPGLAVVGAAVAVALGRAVAVGLGEAVAVAAGLVDREADVVGVAVGDEATSG
jgi:hypothetical protein